MVCDFCGDDLMKMVERENCFGEKREVPNIGIVKKDMNGNFKKRLCRKCWENAQPKKRKGSGGYGDLDEFRKS